MLLSSPLASLTIRNVFFDYYAHVMHTHFDISLLCSPFFQRAITGGNGYEGDYFACKIEYTPAHRNRNTMFKIVFSTQNIDWQVC